MFHEYLILGLVAYSGGATIALLHFMPWHMRLGHELKPPTTYVVGVGWILSCILGWMCVMQPAYPLYIWGVIAITASIGMGDILAYWFERDAKYARWERIDGPQVGRAPRD